MSPICPAASLKGYLHKHENLSDISSPHLNRQWKYYIPSWHIMYHPKAPQFRAVVWHGLGESQIPGLWRSPCEVWERSDAEIRCLDPPLHTPQGRCMNSCSFLVWLGPQLTATLISIYTAEGFKTKAQVNLTSPYLPEQLGYFSVQWPVISYSPRKINISCVCCGVGSVFNTSFTWLKTSQCFVCFNKMLSLCISSSDRVNCYGTSSLQNF